MRFYLTYKDHGLYDPVVDDTEVIYIPVDPVELGIVNIQTNIHETQQKIETIDIKQTGETPRVQSVEEFLSEPDIKDLPFLITVDEIPPDGKFRLPVSDNYDPEGNRVRVNKIKEKGVVTFNVKKILDEASENRNRLQEAQDAVSEYISESKIKQDQKIKEDLFQTDKETDENYIRNKAIEVVSESIDRAISVAKDINENVKNEIRTSDDLTKAITTELSKSSEIKSKSVNIQKESVNKREYSVNVSEEIKKIEKIPTYTTESNVEERKLLTKQEIDETIQSGTVSRTSEMFNNENIEISKPYSIEINKNYDYHTKRDEINYSDSGATQRAFSIGLQTIPHIRENLSSLQVDYRLNLLTTFFLQLTNIMVTLSRFIATEPKTCLAQDYYNQKPQQHRFEKKEHKTTLDKRNEQTFQSFEEHQGQGLSKYKYEHVSNDSEGELIKKGKLSGAKIAQIEGRKTAELTDKMDIVISEFQKKSGFEEQPHDNYFRSRSGSRSKMKSDETQSGTFYSASQKKSHSDCSKIFEEFSETKIQSLDIRETKSEKRSSEFKNTTREVRPYAYESTTTDGKNLTYVAIVEAHVYTNKDAIFEEQMKSEREKKNEDIEKTRLETNRDIRKISLEDTIIIQPTEEISVNEIEDKEIEFKKGITSVEQSTVKIAAKKISEVLEPLLDITSDRSCSVKQVHTIEEPFKSVVQSTDVSTEEFEQYFVATTTLNQKIYPSWEKPTKSVVEITEIIADENERQVLDVIKLNVMKPKSIVEDAKSIAEKTEISIKEDELAVLYESKPHLDKPRKNLESIVKSIAETTEVVTGSNIEMLVIPETFVKTPHTTIESAFRATAETLTILPEESKSDFVEDTIMKQESAKVSITERTGISLKEDELAVLYDSKPHVEKPRQNVESVVKSIAETSEVVTGSNIEMLVTPETLVKTPHTTIESAFRATAETLTVLPEESQSEFVENTKIKQEAAQVLIGENLSTDVFEVSLLEEREESLNAQTIKIEQPTLLLEESAFSVAQKSTIDPVEPKSDIEIFTKVEQKANIQFDELKAIENTIINLEEPGNNIFDTPETIKKYPLTSMEYPNLTIAEVFTILPDESKNKIPEMPEITECKPSIDFVEIEAAETRIIHPEEPKYEQLEVLRIEEKTSETTYVAPTLKLAEITSTIPEEPKVEFYVPELKNQQVGIKFTEFKAAEATIVEAEEFQQPEFNIEQPKEKRSKRIIEPSSFSVAEVFATTMTESSKLLPIEKFKIQVADVGVQEFKAIETTEVALGDLTYNKLTIHVPDTKQLKTSIEKSVQSVAQIMEVDLTDTENKISITSPLVTEVKATSVIEKIKTTEIAKSEEVGRSISPPLSPTTPVVEEYMFSLEAELEHPYVVKEAVTEEASLKIKSQKKEMQSADTSYTLAIESIIERDSETIEEIEEIEKLHLSKEVHESMLQKYETRQSNMSANIDVKTLEANQVMSTRARSLGAHHNLSVKNLTMKQGAINIASLEENQHLSAAINLDASHKLAKTAVVKEHSISSQANDISQSSLHESRKVKSSESQYSAIQKQESLVTSMQSESSASIKAEALQHSEALDKTAVVQKDSMALQDNQSLQCFLHNKTRKAKSSESQYSAVQKQESSVKSMQSESLGASNRTGASQYAEASNEELSISSSKSMESTILEGKIGFGTHQHFRTGSDTYKEDASASVESKSFATNVSASQLSTHGIKGEHTASLGNEKLTLRTNLKNTISNGGQSSSPIVPPTPLTDEYIFRLQTELPEESTFIPRDCSISPESMHEDVVVNGLLTNYKTKIEERILYSPPLPTPPTSPEKTKSVYTKPGLKGGSDRLELTKQEIHDSTLVSAIDRTLKRIEEYKASVGLTSEEMSYHQEDADKEFIPIHIVEEWLDNEAVHDKAKNSQVEEVDAIKITIVTEENDAGETAITVTAEDNVNNENDLKIQEISSHFDEIPLEGVEYDNIVSNEERSGENKVDDFKPIQMYSDENLESFEEDYELVAVHPSSLNNSSAGDGRVTTNQFDSEVLNVQPVTTDMSRELVMLHDQQIIGEEPIVPPVDSLKKSEVIKLLNEERTTVEERKWTTFLQKRYTPTPKTEVVYYGDFDFKTQFIPDAYKVKIVKQPKPKIAPDWKAEELKKQASPIIEITEPTEETEVQERIKEDNNIIEQEDKIFEDKTETEILEELIDKETEELDLEEMAQRNLAEELIKNVENMIDINAPTEQQLEQMRDQLSALAQLPAVIQQTVELVNKRINLISQKEQQKKKEEEEHRRQEEQKRAELEKTKQSLEMRVTKTEEELAIIKKEEVKRILEAKIREEKQKKEKMERMKIDQESRQVTQRSIPRMGQPMPSFGPLQERPVILPGGRKWRTPEDVYDEELINETLVGQAEVIKGTAIGVNFMKFEKPPPPLDHLKHSEVFKAIHDAEQPLKKVELLGPVLSEADYRERARSMSPCVEKVAESTRTKQLHP